MKQADLNREVEELIEARLAVDGIVAKSWIVKEMVDRHGDIHGDDALFAKLCMFGHVDTTVRLVLQERRRKEGDVDADRQQVLPGFKRLQRSYSVVRDDEQKVVRLEEMTIAEGRAKEQEQRRMARGCIAHAEELKDYFDQRAVAAA